MKITVEVDVSPKELREFFGLPDIAGLQDDMIRDVREKVKEGAVGFDPLSVMKPFLPEGMRSLDNIQKGLVGTLRSAVIKEQKKESKGED